MGRPRSFDRDQALTRALDVFWRRGYEHASLVELCKAMNIGPPSLYAAFGNKAKLFLAAVDYYERTYWQSTWEGLAQEDDVHRAIDTFFIRAANILLSEDAPCGCLVVMAAASVLPESTEIYDVIHSLRQTGKKLFLQRLLRGVEDGQLSPQCNVVFLSAALNTLLEGMSIQGKDGLTQAEMAGVASHAMLLLKQ